MVSFRVVDSASAPSNGNEVLLGRDNWNDWFTWVTQFHVIVVTEDRRRIDIGNVKIAKAGMTPESAVGSALRDPVFSKLEAPWFSIGQTENYYEQLNELGEQLRDEYLLAMRDMARNPSLLEEYAAEEVL